MVDWRKDRIASAVNGANPTVIAKMKSGFAVFGDTQFLPGYCVLLHYPKVKCLNDLSIADRSAFLTDMGVIGDAIKQVLKPMRINYEILGNTDAFLHAHIFPRYDWEEEMYRKKPVWLYPEENWTRGAYCFDQKGFADIKAKIQSALIELLSGIES